MGKTEQFRTQDGYRRESDSPMSAAMEDYLEMICRILGSGEDVRARDLSRLLGVRPSSVSRMLRVLDDAGYLRAERYGLIHLTEEGRVAGNYLLYRHDTVRRFLRALNHGEDMLEETERIEHYLTPLTVRNLERLTNSGKL